MKRVFFFVISCFSMGVSAQTDSLRHVDLSEIVVSATRANHRTPTAFSNIKALDVQKIMVSPEIPSAIGFSQSVVTTSENGALLGNSSFRVRGSDATRTNVTFDGVPVNDGESQAVFWVNMPDLMSSLQTMQIQRGVGTSVNGAAAFGATLNMQTAQPAAQPYGQASVVYGSFNTFKLNTALGTGRSKNGWNADLRYSLGQTDGYIDHSGSDQQSLFFTGGYSNSRRAIKTNIFHGEQHTDISWEGVPEVKMAENRRYNPSGWYTDSNGNTVRYNNETDNYRQTHVHLHYSEQLSGFFKMNAILYYTRGNGYYEQYKPAAKLSKYGLPNFDDGGKTIKTTDLIRQKWLDNHLWGATVTTAYTTDKTRAHIGVSGSYFSNDHFGRIIWAQVRQAVPKDHEWYLNTGKKTDVSAYLKITQQLNRRWYAFGDFQWRHIGYDMTGTDDDIVDLAQEHQYDFFNPKAGITFAISPQQRAYASFAVGHREPTRADIKDAFKNGGTAMPRPETLYDAEAGYEQNNDVWTIGVNLFYMYYIDQLVNTGKVSDSGYALMENVPESYRAGIELTLGVRPLKSLSINGNLAYSRNKIRNYVAHVDAPTADNPIFQIEERLGTTDIAFSPEWVGAADVSYEIVRGLSIGATAKYVGKQYYDNTSNAGRRLDGYFVNNVIARYRHDFKNFYAELQFAVNNLWNADYITNATVYRGYNGSDYWENRSFFPQPFRNYIVKLTVGF